MIDVLLRQHPDVGLAAVQLRSANRKPIPCGHGDAAQRTSRSVPGAVRLAGRISYWPHQRRAAPRATPQPSNLASQSEHNGSTIPSTMFDVKVDRSETTALHDQVAAEIRRAIADGEAGPGERLPLAKDMAAVLGVNKNTVLRALHILRDEGLLDFQRGRGITVAGTPERGVVVNHVRDLLEFCRIQGYRRDEVIQIIEGLS